MYGGLAPGPLRCGGDRLARPAEFRLRDGIEVVAIDPSAPFAATIRRALPDAWLVVDHWHLHRLANQMLTRVRQRATQQVHGHRGRVANDA